MTVRSAIWHTDDEQDEQAGYSVVLHQCEVPRILAGGGLAESFSRRVPLVDVVAPLLALEGLRLFFWAEINVAPYSRGAFGSSQ